MNGNKLRKLRLTLQVAGKERVAFGRISSILVGRKAMLPGGVTHFQRRKQQDKEKWSGGEVSDKLERCRAAQQMVWLLNAKNRVRLL